MFTFILFKIYVCIHFKIAVSAIFVPTYIHRLTKKPMYDALQ
jgi:hypothetical protein